MTETIEYKLTGEDRYCPDCGTKYKVVTKEVVKRLKFILSTFEVVEEVTYVLGEFRKMEPFPKPDDLNRLLPWSNELPEGFRTKEKK